MLDVCSHIFVVTSKYFWTVNAIMNHKHTKIHIVDKIEKHRDLMGNVEFGRELL